MSPKTESLLPSSIRIDKKGPSPPILRHKLPQVLTKPGIGSPNKYTRTHFEQPASQMSSQALGARGQYEYNHGPSSPE